jgi:hypothetical protein
VSIGASTASTGAFTNLAYTGTLTGGTGVINIGSGQLYKDASGNVGIGTSSPASYRLRIVGNAADGLPLRWENPAGTMVGVLGVTTTSSFVYAGTEFSTPYVLITNNTERMRIDSAGNVGIGTSSPATRLHVAGNLFVQNDNTTNQLTIRNGSPGSTGSPQFADILFEGFAGNDKARIRGINIDSSTSSGSLSFETFNGSSLVEAMRIDSSGNLLVGETARAYLSRFTLSYDPSSTNGPIFLDTRSFAINRGAFLWLGGKFNASGDYRPYGGVGALKENGTDGNSAGYLSFQTNGNNADSTERMRIDSSGNLLVGTTSTSTTNGGVVAAPSANSYLEVGHGSSASSGVFYGIFKYNGSIIGSITQSGTTAVAYNTSSDYRLKHDIQPMTGALAKVAQLKPVTYKWNADDSQSQGFIAHELQEVVPECVTGEKDAVDAEGKPVYQGIDTSFLVATLTAALQEAVAEINSLKARLDAANL